MAERRGLLWAVVAMLAVAASGLWLASLLVWTWQVQITGGIAVVRELRGGQAEPALIGLALASLAAVAAVLATAGWARRAVGVLVLGGGAGALVLAGFGLVEPRTMRMSDVGFERWADEVARWSVQAWVGVGLVALAGVLLVAGGVLVLVAGHRMPRMGSRYQRAPEFHASGRAAPEGAVPEQAVPEQAARERAVGEGALRERAVSERAVHERAAHERAAHERAAHERALWDELDAGGDPTI
jgi:hypothetical protein